jgi:eukaryotic-like serine/threonine-protein kinase
MQYPVKPKNPFHFSGIVFIFLIQLFSLNLFAKKPDSIPDFTKLPNLKWTFSTKAPVYSSPVVMDGTVFVGGTDSILYVLDLISGKEKWRFRTKGQIRSTICLGSERVYLNGGDGNLYALDRKDGRVIWTFRTKGERKYDFADYFHSTPVLQNGVLYFGSGDGYFYSLRASDGKLIWKFKTGDVIHATAALSGDRIFFGSFDGFVYALNITDGALIWKFKTVGHRIFPKGEVQGSPTVFDSLVFVGARDFNVYALDMQKGYCHWNKAFTIGWGLCNTVYDSILYIGSADERRLIAANPATGEEFWNKPMEFLVFGNNAYSDSMLYVGTTIGKLHGIVRETGLKTWTFVTDSYSKNTAKYFKADDSYRDNIRSIIKSNEQFLEVEEELGGIFSAPWISSGNIVFTSTNGKVYCLTRSEKD